MSKQASKSRNTLQLNLLVKSLIDAGLIETIVEAPMQKPGDYQFGLDDKVDAKLFPSLVRTAYTAVIGAKFREEGRTGPLFDEEDDAVETSHKPEDRELEPVKPLSYADAQRYASAVYRMAVSQGRHEDGRWLLGMTKRNVTKDKDGYHVEITHDTPIKPFAEWMKDEKARTTDDSPWFATIIYAEQLGTDVPMWHDGVDEARALFHEWLADIPWSRDNLTQTRLERAITRAADRKWAAFKKAVQIKDGRQTSKLLDDWTLLVHSPMMAVDQASIKASKLFKLTVVKGKQEELLAEAQTLEFERMIAESMQEMQALIGTIKAEREKIAQIVNGPVQAEQQTQHSSAVPASLMPRVIEGRRRA